jgi:dephospho-CoA kinase
LAHSPVEEAVMRRIGLTGGIGSGKSTVAALLVAEGAVLVDTDAIARRIAQPGGLAMPAIEAAFGQSVIAPDGGLDRAGMRQLVFADSSARKRLESILHPLIGAETERLAAAAGPDAVVVFDVPLLVESGRWRAMVDRVLVLDRRSSARGDRPAGRAQVAPRRCGCGHFQRDALAGGTRCRGAESLDAVGSARHAIIRDLAARVAA